MPFLLNGGFRGISKNLQGKKDKHSGSPNAALVYKYHKFPLSPSLHVALSSLGWMVKCR